LASQADAILLVVRVSRKPLKGVGVAELRAARLAAGLTQVEAARLCEVGARTYHRWEAGGLKRIRSVFLDRLRDAAAQRRTKQP
jgi:DNA-binding XRE family transcriptional regulator